MRRAGARGREEEGRAEIRLLILKNLDLGLGHIGYNFEHSFDIGRGRSQLNRACSTNRMVSYRDFKSFRG